MFFNLKLPLPKTVLSFSFAFLFSLVTIAEDHGAPAADAPGGAAKKPPANTGAGGDKAWVTLQNQVLVLSTRRKQLQQNMAALKDQTHHHTGKGKEDPKHIKHEVDQLVKLYKEYKDVTEEYNKLIVVLKYRHPERLAKDDAREYKPIEVESLQELEEKLDIEGRLSKVYKKAQAQYSAQKEREPASTGEKPNLPKGVEPGLRGNTIREQDPILLSQ